LKKLDENWDQKDILTYLKNEGNSIIRTSNAMHFNFLELLKCFIQTQGKQIGVIIFS